MRWFHLLRALAAGTGQSTTPSSLLWMFIFENYADQSLDRRRRLIGMMLGTRFFICGMNGSVVLLQVPVPIHGLTSHAKIIRIWQGMLPLCLRIGGFNVCSWRPLGARRAGRPRHTWESKLQAYCKYTNVGSWREAALDEMVWNSHVGSFVDFCRM